MKACRKCGGTDLKVHWAPNHVDGWHFLRIFDGPCYAEPHTHFKCKRCGYDWLVFDE